MKIDHVKNLGQALIEACETQLSIHVDFNLSDLCYTICGRVNENGDMFIYDANAINTYARQDCEVTKEMVNGFDKILKAIEKTSKKHGVIKK